jgi:[protein-PII] uridylyltransferase
MLTPAPDLAPALFDRAGVAAELSALTQSHVGNERELRLAISRRLKQALIEGRAAAERQLVKNRLGRRCAERLSAMTDEIILLLFDIATRQLYPAQNPSEAERMAIVATGGYGRQVLAAGSDIDLLFLLPYKQTAWGEQVAEAILYCLWDMGLKVGHATRSVSECIRQARTDMTARTALLEARYLLGDRRLYEELLVRFDKEIVQGTAPEFVAAKLAEREERHRRSGQSRYLVEPNVKDGKGGLRDLHTLYWIAKYVYRIRDRTQLIELGVFEPREYSRFKRCGEFLWAVRSHLHFIAGRAEERLSFDVQREIALRLGYTQHPGMRDVERFMKHYFLVAKDVGDLTAVLCAKLEDAQAKPMPVLSRMMARLRPRPRRALAESPDFVVDYNRLTVADKNVFQHDPVNLIRIFHLAQKYNLVLHPDAMHLVTRSLKLVDEKLREDAGANRLFLEILTAKNAAEIILRRMNELGVLGRFIPAFGRIVAMMQFNMYHHYTVDEHLVRCIGVLADIEEGRSEDTKFANELMRTIQPGHRKLLYLALFLHDVAKGRVEDHSIGGARVARSLAPRLGFTMAETETVAWLIEVHLVMSTLAQSRDLSDRVTIENFSTVMQSVERMKLLAILTCADIKAVGPGVWNSWKAQLIRTLYYETEPVLTGGFSEVDRARRVALAQDELRAELSDWSKEEIDAYIALHYPAYWLKVDVARKVAHARFLHAAVKEGKALATTLAFPAARGVTELTVLAPDHPWLLSTIAGACAAAGANIVDAQIYTTTDGRALDTIAVTREFELDEDEARRAQRITATIEKALRGDVRLPEVVAKRAASKGRQRPFVLEPEVTINNNWSSRYTMVEVTGLDRLGLLFELTAALSKLNLNIASAHVATFGERVVDVFYITDLFGAKVTSATRQVAIKRALISLFTGKPDAEQRLEPAAVEA